MVGETPVVFNNVVEMQSWESKCELLEQNGADLFVQMVVWVD